MVRVLFLTLFVGSSLHAESYSVLLEKALSNNINLQIAKSQQESFLLEGEIEIRLENPNLEFAIADFSSRRILRENEFGTSVGISQSLLLPSVKEDKKRVTQSKIAVSREHLNLKKFEFIYNFNMNYLAYKEALAEQMLKEEKLRVLTKILETVEKQFLAGSVAKSDFLNAQIIHRNSLTQLKLLEVNSLQRKNTLLLMSNLEADTVVQSEHIFVRETSDSLHPLLKVSQKEEALTESKLAVASHSIDKIELFSEIEVEPDEDIFRVGMSIPLPLFNQKLEEKQLAKIALINQRLTLSSQKKRLSLEVLQLEKEIALKDELHQNYRALLVEQKSVLEMYEASYSIAKVNLLKVLESKKSLIETKEKILKTEIAIEQDIIKLNYLQGAYSA